MSEQLKTLAALNSCSQDPSCLTSALLSHCRSVDIFSNFLHASGRVCVVVSMKYDSRCSQLAVTQ